MDFLKACATNVQAIDAFSTPYRLYQSPLQHDKASEKLTPSSLSEAAVSLRRRGTLATHRARELLVFGDSNTEEEAYFTSNPVFERGVSGTLDAAAFAQQPELFRLFLEALEGVLSIKLSGEDRAVRCGKMAWLVPHESCSNGKVFEVMRLRMHFNAAGSLLISSGTSDAVFESMRKDRNGEITVILAPCNEIAIVAPGGLADTMSTDNKKQWRDERWMKYVMEALEAEGLLIDDEDIWVKTRWETSGTDRPQAHGGEAEWFLWPANLCFVPHGLRSDCDKQDGRQWFRDNFMNPLAEADDWYLDAEEREKVASELKRQLEAQLAPLPSAPDAAPSELVTSPLFNHRSDLQHMAGIYPTPPDGLVAGSVPHVSSDPSTQVVQEYTLTADAMHQDSFGPDAEARARGRSLVSSIGGYQGNTDDLFGDMGDLGELGNDEVGDEDFSFFDEPDEPASTEPGALDTDFYVYHNNTDMTFVGPKFDHGNELDALAESPNHVAGVADDPDTPTVEQIQPHLKPAQESSDASVVESNDESKQPNTEALRPPLSPFGIRERLLPPPVPASVAKSGTELPSAARRQSSFDPVAFNEDLDIDAKYREGTFAMWQEPSRTDQPGLNREISIKLPPKRKKRRSRRAEPASQPENAESLESEEDSSTDPSFSSDDDLPPKMPWETRKRKRLAEMDALTPLTAPVEWMISGGEADDDGMDDEAEDHLRGLLAKLLSGTDVNGVGALWRSVQQRDKFEHLEAESEPNLENDIAAKLPELEDAFDLSGQDVVGIAQLVAEQSMLRTFDGKAIASDFVLTTSLGPEQSDKRQDHSVLSDIIKRVMPATVHCDIAKLALTISNPERSGFPAKGQPRPNPQRSEIGNGPLIFSLPPPYVRVMRAESHWEMLPPAVSVWEALGLSPASGPKDVRWWCIVPSTSDLESLADGFVQELGSAYEGCKLGSHLRGGDSQPDEEDGGWPETVTTVRVEGEQTPRNVLQAYRSTCRDFGHSLASVRHEDSGRTNVIYVVNPFSDPDALKHLCSCFWEMYKAYRESPKSLRNKPRSDLFLQILPIGLIASPDALVMHDAATMCTLAREVYDRCPPAQLLKYPAALPIQSAPAVELAATIPRKIYFQLAADPPSDLLHAGSMLHLAYARSDDRLWVFAAWTDNTGRYQAWNSYSLHGRSLADAIKEIWDMTESVLAARQMAWRIFIAAVGDVDVSEQECWRVVTDGTQQKGSVIVLLTTHKDTPIRLSPPEQTANGAPGGVFAAGFLTPISTPQTTTFTVSPEASGTANAPPTPAASESNQETDPDAHLVDTTDETWGMLVEPSLLNTRNDVDAQPAAVATGLLVRRGFSASDSEKSLPCLGVNLIWTLPETLHMAKRPEAVMREVLSLYRNLSLLTTLRGIGGADELMPWHVAAASRGAKALNGFV